MYSAAQLTDLLCAGLHSPLLRLASSSPMAVAFARDAASIPAHALIRHAAEHVFRIRVFRPLDTAATRVLERKNGAVAEQWARYARSEAVHDRYFLRDLGAAGFTPHAIENMHAFSSTARLGDFVGRAMRSYGALPVVLYSFWAEMNSEVGSPRIAARTEEVFGKGSSRGALAHRALDEGQNHPALISHVLTALIRDDDEVFLAIGLLDGITSLLGEYFAELGTWSGRVPAVESPQSSSGRVDRPTAAAHAPPA